MSNVTKFVFNLKLNTMENKKHEPIESICYLFLEMAVSDGQASKLEIETVIELITDLMNSDKETQILSKRSSTDAIIIVPHCYEVFVKNRSLDFLNTHIMFLKDYLHDEEKTMKINMLGYLAKIDDNVDEGEVRFFNHVKKAWDL